jgi:hemoglobin
VVDPSRPNRRPVPGDALSTVRPPMITRFRPPPEQSLPRFGAAVRGSLSSMVASPFDSAAGAALIRTAVDVFYRRVHADEMVGGYFAGVDAHRLAAHQRAFLVAALGGPNTYAGRDLAVAHAGLAIDDAAYDRIVEHLLAALRDLEVPAGVLHRLVQRLAELRPSVVTRQAG